MSEAEPTANQRTLLAYEQAAARYRAQVGATPNPELKQLLTEIARLAPGTRVLELGSGPGLDARELEALGMTVRRTDAALGFVELLRADGYTAEVLNALTDDFGGPYGAILADAVFLHFTAADLDSVLRKAVLAAPVLAFTVKEGDGEFWSSARLGLPRWFALWREEALTELLGATGWDLHSLVHYAGRHDAWLYILATRAGHSP